MFIFNKAEYRCIHVYFLQSRESANWDSCRTPCGPCVSGATSRVARDVHKSCRDVPRRPVAACAAPRCRGIQCQSTNEIKSCSRADVSGLVQSEILKGRNLKHQILRNPCTRPRWCPDDAIGLGNAFPGSF